ncbi:YciI family protein [Nocardioides sp.]|uniref:YciI family protein n=1 Tax=Nocardioides sp. TaxID=35761 RepID=UPI003519AF14
MTSTPAVEYMILLTGDEQAYARASEAELGAVMQRHMEFAEQLAARGHVVTGGAELQPSGTGKVLRASGGSYTLTDGPYAEGAEQVGGFYTVRTTDLDDLVEVCKILAEEDDGAIEIRPCVDHSGGES